jgi:chaperone BCS1
MRWMGNHLYDVLGNSLHLYTRVTASEERIIFMTTNHLERLDHALIRPGRVDVRVLIDHVTEHQARRLFLRFYPNQESLSDEFIQVCKDKGTFGVCSAASMQGHFVMHRDDPKSAITAWMDS